MVPWLVTLPPAFCATWTFTALFTTCHHLSLSWATLIQSRTSKSISLTYILIFTFPSMPRFYKWSLPFKFPHQNPVCLSLPTACDTCPAHLTVSVQEYNHCCSSLRNFMHSCYFPPLRPKWLPLPFRFVPSLMWNKIPCQKKKNYHSVRWPHCFQMAYHKKQRFW